MDNERVIDLNNEIYQMPESICCEMMKDQLTHRCDKHPDPYECPDNIMVYSRQHGYGVPVHDGGSSFIVIKYCPWCGVEGPSGWSEEEWEKYESEFED